MIMRYLYSLSIYLFQCGILLASPFNKKASKWVNGRKKWRSELRAIVKDQKDLFWLHCSSFGEFEQGRPFIEELHQRGIKVLLTFFSPSGYENQKNFASAYHVAYLPVDSMQNAQDFIDIVQPKAVFFVKYEFWFNYMMVLNSKNIPLFIVSGIFRKDQYFFKSYGKWFAHQLKDIRHFFVQNAESKKLLSTIGIAHASVSGDTRFDRVAKIVSKPKQLNNIDLFAKGSIVFIGGSTWFEDDKMIKYAYDEFKEMKFIIVPHEVGQNRLNEISEHFNNEGVFYSKLQEPPNDCRLIIVDTVGELSSMYQYANIAFIGGGYGKGIHNTLEAAAFGLPICFGPNYTKFQEAKDLVKLTGASVINDKREFIDLLHRLSINEKRLFISKINKDYIQEKQGATSKIMEELVAIDLISI